MKNDKLIPGLILVLIGGVILLDNFGYIDFHWGNIWHLWPMFLIIAGVNLVFAHNRSPLATILKIGVVVVGFALLLFGNFGDRFGFPYYYNSWDWHGHNHHHDNNDMDDDDDDDTAVTNTSGSGIVKVEGNSNFNMPYSAYAQVAQLSISGGGSTYTLNDTTNQLFTADTKTFFGKYEFTHQKEGSVYVLNFDMKDNKGHFHWDTDKSNTADFKLNPNPEWELNVDAGATKLNFDLTKFKIRSLELSGGAASFDVKLGEPLATTNVTVSTGVSEVNINIPNDAACSITTDSGLSSTTFDGFTKNGDDKYETPGFAAAKNKIYINMSGGISDFKVHRY